MFPSSENYCLAPLRRVKADSPLVIKIQKMSYLVVFRTVLVVVIMDFYHWSESGKEDSMQKVKLVKVHTDAEFCDRAKTKIGTVISHWRYGDRKEDGRDLRYHHRVTYDDVSLSDLTKLAEIGQDDMLCDRYH
jgi:hypothetical protein